MPSLWIRATEFTLSPAAGGISTVTELIAQGLPALGYKDVSSKGSLADGLKGDFFFAILYLPISGANFWQVMSCGGTGGQAEAEADFSAVQNMINNFHFL